MIKKNKMKKIIIATILLMSTKCYSQEFEGGFIKVRGTGGTPPYTFSLDGGSYQIKDTFFNVVAGQHSITTKDAKNCIKTSVCTMYNNVKMVVLSTTTKSVTFKASGGKPPYSFSRNSTTSWSLNKTLWTELRRNTPYTFRVKDALGYIYFINITL
jgi:hypothetical protein